MVSIVIPPQMVIYRNYAAMFKNAVMSKTSNSRRISHLNQSVSELSEKLLLCFETGLELVEEYSLPEGTSSPSDEDGSLFVLTAWLDLNRFVHP
jgi:hypothetical protein